MFLEIQDLILFHVVFILPLQLKPRKRKAKLWQFALPEELVWHVLASRRRQSAAGEDSSDDLEDNTELLNLVLQAADRDNLSDDSEEDEETSDGS